MKLKNTRTLAAMLAALMLISACAPKPADEPPPTAPAPSAENTITPESAETEQPPILLPPQEKIRVFDIADLLGAIGSNREITIDGEELLLPDDDGLINMGEDFLGETLYGNPHVRFSELDGKAGLVISGVTNMTIRADLDENDTVFAAITSNARYCNILMFDSCSDITLKNLIVCHNADFYMDTGYATGEHLLSFTNCERVELENVLLNGSERRSGIYVANTVGLTADNVSIYYTSFSIFEAHQTSEITLQNCEFFICRGGVRLSDVKGFRMENSSVEVCEGYTLFECSNTEDVAVISSELLDNSHHTLASGAIKFSDNSLNGGNYFEKSPDFAISAIGEYTGSRTAEISESYALALVAAVAEGDKLNFAVEGTDTVDGEETYIVRVFNDMETHIATLAWYNVGIYSAQLWQLDIAAGENVLQDISLTETQLYKIFLASRDWAREEEPVDIETLEVTDYIIEDFDGDGKEDLWFEAYDDYYANVSGLFRVVGNRAVEVMYASHCGGSMGGTYVVIHYDLQRNQTVFGYLSYSGGWGGASSWYAYYTYHRGELTRIASFGTETYWEYDEDTADSLDVTKFYIDEKPATEAEFEVLYDRFLPSLPS